MKTVQLDENIKYALDKVGFEMSRSVSNLMFMMNKNLDNADFLESDIFKKLQDRVLDCYINHWEVTNAMLEYLNIKTHKWRTSEDNYTLIYED